MNVLRGHRFSRQTSRRFRHHNSTVCPDAARSFNRITGRSFTVPVITPHTGQGPSRAVCSMITVTLVVSTRWTSRTRNSSSSPNNTDVASDMLVASLLDVVGDQQHVGATSLDGYDTSVRAPRLSSKRFPNGGQPVLYGLRIHRCGHGDRAVPPLLNCGSAFVEVNVVRPATVICDARRVGAPR